MNKLLFGCALTLGCLAVETLHAQDEIDLKPKINLLLRSSLEIPTNGGTSSINLNESRFEILGNVNPQLEYRVRYRLNRSQTQRALDNAPGSLDIASVNYKFGQDNKYSVMVGKMAAFVGNWEFENNPTFEYQYSEHVNNQLNLFLLGIKLGYQINRNHSFQVQVHNTVNHTFNELYDSMNFGPDGNQASKVPMGVYLIWQGKMFDDAFKTFWSYNVSQVAKSKTNHMISLGNRFAAGPVEGYLDLSYASNPVDYFGVATAAINASTPITGFARGVNYTTAAFRINYNFVPKWYLTAKTFIDRSEGDVMTKFDRNNIGLLAGLEFKPFEKQDMKFFGYYFNRDQQLKYAGNKWSSNEGMFGFGILYLVNALK